MKALLFSTFLLSLFFLSCTSSPVSSNTTADPPRRNSTIRAAMRAPVWQFVYAARTEDEEAVLRKTLEDLIVSKPLAQEIQLVNSRTATPDMLGSTPLFFIGNTLPAMLPTNVEILDEGPSFRDVDFRNTGDILKLHYIKNPWTNTDTTIAMHLVYSPDINTLAKTISAEYTGNWRELLWTKADYEISLEGKPHLRGSFKRNQWTPDPNTEINLGAADTPVYQDSSWVFMAPEGAPSAERLGSLKNRLNTARNNLSPLFTKPVDTPAKVFIFPSVERIGLWRENMERVQFDRKEEALYLVLSSEEEHPFHPILEYQLLQWMQSVSDEDDLGGDFIEAGIAVRSNADFYHRYRNFAIALAKKEALLTLDRLNDRNNRTEAGSFLYDASALAYLESLLPTTSGLLSRQDIATLKSKKAPRNWQKIMASQPLVSPESSTSVTKFRKGMTFAHEGYRTYNGYGGSTVKPSLDSLAELSVNSLSIVPYTFQRDPHKPGDLPVAGFAGGENDDAVTYSIRQAHQRGWSILLKPQIWVGSAWPGDISFDSEADWQKFFHRYTEWIAHYAMLAEVEGVDALCIGTEMVRTTIDKPEAWREIIALLRTLYSGRLTYAANWGEEFENLTFWNKLDIIGLNSYYPLSTEQEPSDQELLKGATDWVAKAEKVAEKFNKKWWLTEVGFRSVRRAWLNPHADVGDRDASNDCQNRCFQALVDASRNAEHLNGMYIWKWPSYLGRERGRRQPGTGFTPGGKPAAEAVRAFYQER